ncbi:MBL fold metallo-hydrolase [Nigerium massiliense]|uniref:MBL fold metallo-hydrolase n=1 Tax=Nigerium massiliense TaxID=1522317 RepID=UPI00058B6183|nr:MBL fold metallo-hydrolase [Nigerium massiliense]
MLQVTKQSVGPMDNNAYLLSDGGVGLLIDAANEPNTLLSLVGDTTLQTIVTTHRHPDHIQALTELAGASGARLVAGSPDVAAITASTGLSIEGVWDGDTVEIAGVSLDVIGLVGHTPGSIALALRPEDGPAELFTGDSLFPGGIGRTTSPEDFTSLINDVQAKLFDVFADDTVVRPGHGDDTTLGAERPHLAEWRQRGW